ncbi:hypothetical protein ABEF95_001819 [Exophiala dermatitidis]
MPADFGAVTCTAKSLTGSDLFLIWKEITHDLVARGHAAELYQELKTGHTVEILSEESDSDHDIYDEMIIPSHLVDEAADLSQYYSANSPTSFEQAFAQERLVSPGNSGQDEVDDVLDHLHSDLNTLSSTSLSPLTVPPIVSAQPEIPPSSPSEILQRELCGSEQRKSIDKEIEVTASPLVPSTRRRKCSQRPRGLRLNDKKNLKPAAMPVVADLLVSADGMSYFLSHCRAIYESWMPSTSDSLDHSSSIETRVVAALDRVQDLLNGNRVCRLLLRFAYLQLAWSIDAYMDVAADDRVLRRVRRKVGHRDATVAIDLYLETKRKVSGQEVKRSRLLGYCRTGRRWAVLAGGAPLFVLIFPQMADTIMYVPPSPHGRDS